MVISLVLWLMDAKQTNTESRKIQNKDRRVGAEVQKVKIFLYLLIYLLSVSFWPSLFSSLLNSQHFHIFYRLYMLKHINENNHWIDISCELFNVMLFFYNIKMRKKTTWIEDRNQITTRWSITSCWHFITLNLPLEMSNDLFSFIQHVLPAFFWKNSSLSLLEYLNTI